MAKHVGLGQVRAEEIGECVLESRCEEGAIVVRIGDDFVLGIAPRLGEALNVWPGAIQAACKQQHGPRQRLHLLRAELKFRKSAAARGEGAAAVAPVNEGEHQATEQCRDRFFPEVALSVTGPLKTMDQHQRRPIALHRIGQRHSLRIKDEFLASGISTRTQ